MKNVNPHTHQILLSILLIITACVPMPAVRVYVTPTAAQTETPVSSSTLVMPTETQAPAAAQAITPAPTSSPTFLGAVVGPSYTPPVPTQTPLPTSELPPTLAPTNTPSGPTPTPIPTLDPSRMGVQIDPNVTNEAWFYIMDRVTQLGVRWIKIQFNWNFYQPASATEWSENMRRIELYLFEANRRGINVMLSIAKAPAWARSNQIEDGPPDDPQVLANFLTFLFSGGPQEFNLMEQVDAIEVWNEPNLAREWRGQPMDGATYMRYFAAAYQAIRAANPTIPIVTAGLAPTGDSTESRDDRSYLTEMYAAGLGSYRDVYIGAHPFSWGNPPDAVCCDAVAGQGWDDNPRFFFMNTLNDYRDIMNQNGHNDIQMWLTEFGWATWERFSSPISQEWMTYNDLWEQANYTVRAFEIGQQRGDIAVMVLWNLNFANETVVNASSEIAGYAIMPDNGIRPAFWMIHDAVRPPEQRLNRYDMSG